jgi:hypothetical protein
MLELKKIWLIILVMVLMAVSSIVSILVFINFYQEKSVAPQISSSVADDYMIPLDVVLPDSSVPETPVDPTADWSIFEFKIDQDVTETDLEQPENEIDPNIEINKELAIFSFKYPEVFKIDQLDSGVKLTATAIEDLELDVLFKETDKSLSDIVTETDEFNAVAFAGQPAVEVVFSNDESLIAGNQAIFRQEKLLDKGLERYIIYFKNNNVLYSISLTAPKANDELLSLFAVFVDNFKINN